MTMRHYLMIGALSGALFAALCGPAAADITAKAIKVGVLTDMSGPFASAQGPGSVMAAQIAAEEFGGRINGKTIEILQADHQNKADLGAVIARRWFDQEEVAAVADLGSSSVALAVQELVRANNRVSLVSGAGTSELTNKSCAPTSIHWTWDTYAQSAGVAKAIWQTSKEPWYFVTADYAFGHAMERDTTDHLKRLGGTVAGVVRAPLETSDYSSFLLQAQGSGAKVLALATASGTVTAMKQASEFGIAQSGMKIVPMLLIMSEIHAIGLDLAQGAYTLTAFFHEQSEEARVWSETFYKRMGFMPTQHQAGVYSAVRHFLQAVKDTNTVDGPAVVAKMKATPVKDMFTPHGVVRDDGRMVHDMYLVQVKAPSEVKKPWDYVRLVATVPGEQAFRPLAESACPLVKK